MQANTLFQHLADSISKLRQDRPTPFRIAINGIEGTGKTHLAERFTAYLQQQGEIAIHVSIDGFHFNKAHRYRQGRDSAQGYYEDSYHELAFVEKVLLASQSASPHYTPAIHDLETDAYLDLSSISISPNSILITDGAYLFKPNYAPHWDLKIYLKTDFKTALERGVARDAEHLGGVESAKEKFRLRYHKASQIYLAECQPEAQADIVIDNTNFEDLQVLKMP